MKFPQDLSSFDPMPEGAVALKFADEVSDAEWITDPKRLTQLKQEGASVALMVTVRGKHYEWDSVVQIMEDNLREAVHLDLAPCSPAEFLTGYLALHQEMFPNEDFLENVRTTCREVLP